MIEKNQQESLLSLIPTFSLQDNTHNFLINSQNLVQELVLYLCAILYQQEKNNKLTVYNELFQFINSNFPNTNNPLLLAQFHFLLLQKNISFFEKLPLLSNPQDKEFFITILNTLINNPLFNTQENHQLFMEIYQQLEKNTKKKTFTTTLNTIKNTLEIQAQNLRTQIQNVLPKRSIQNEELLKNPANILQEKLFTLFSHLENDENIKNNQKLYEEIENFKSTLEIQNYQIIIVGEGKRGKSSLINAFLGEELSQIEETAPQTAVPLEFYFQEKPSYFIEFLDEFDQKKQKEISPNTHYHN